MRKNPIFGYLIIAFVILAIGYGIYSKLPDTNKETISSQGSAVMTADADEVSVYINIETLADSADASSTENSKISDKVLFALYELGVSRADINTEQFSIHEQFDWTEEGRESLGFRTTNVLKVKTSDFMIIGKIVDVATTNGALINYINFELSDETEKELKKQALEEAAGDAKDKAEALVAGVGGKLGKIVSVSESGYAYRPFALYEKGASEVALAQAVSTDIVPKELEVTANVNVVFELK